MPTAQDAGNITATKNALHVMVAKNGGALCDHLQTLFFTPAPQLSVHFSQHCEHCTRAALQVRVNMNITLISTTPMGAFTV